MLDIKFIRDNRDIVEAAIKNKKGKPVDLDRIFELEDERKKTQQEISELNRKRNEAADARNIDEGKRLKAELAILEARTEQNTKELVKLLILIPNVPSPDTPIGENEQANRIIRKIGEPPVFSFKPREHWDIGKRLNLIDNERAGNVSGARFTYLKGDLALLQFALISYGFSVLTNQKKLDEIAKGAGLSISTKPFVPVVPPVMMKSAVMNRMARLDPIEERYYFEKDDLVLVGSAEHTLGPLHMDEILDGKDLPIRYAGYSTAFRREAGSYGKDTKGILRVHQFDKLEVETFCLPEDSYKEQDFLVAIQEYLVRSLGLPYQVVLISTGDMGFPDQRQIDIEIWMPGQEKYRETHSADLIGGFQARRLNTRFRGADGKTEHIHMNDATAYAVGRTLIAIMENNQREDGTISIPEVLRPYMGKDSIGA